MSFFKKPSHDRDWSPDQAVLPTARIEGDFVRISHIRNCDYRSVDDYTVRYCDREFDLRKLKRLWLILEPFRNYSGPAHVLLSFEFDGDQFVAISPEIRKKRGEKFSAWRGLWRAYELMYVIADERDVVRLRSNYRRDRVYAYPIKASRSFVRRLFVDMLLRANDLARNPEFYHTITNACGANIIRHVNKFARGAMPWNIYAVLPERVDGYLLKRGLIDSDLPLAKLRERFAINDRALRYDRDPDFSRKIRAEERPASAQQAERAEVEGPAASASAAEAQHF